MILAISLSGDVSAIAEREVMSGFIQLPYPYGGSTSGLSEWGGRASNGYRLVGNGNGNGNGNGHNTLPDVAWRCRDGRSQARFRSASANS